MTNYLVTDEWFLILSVIVITSSLIKIASANKKKDNFEIGLVKSHAQSNSKICQFQLLSNEFFWKKIA